MAQRERAARQRRLVIMPMGDSLTYGLGAPGGYRKPLQDRLIAAGLRYDMVGAMPPVSGDPSPDRHHWGRDGWLISGERDSLTGKRYAALGARAARSNPFSRPLSRDIGAAISRRHFSRRKSDVNVLLLQVGTNDVLNQVVERGAEGPSGIGEAVIDRLRSFLRSVDQRARRAGLQLEVLVGTLQQLAPSNRYGIPVSSVMRSEITEVNRRMPAMVRRSRFEAIAARVVPVGGAVGSNLMDGIHPSGSGYQAMAAAWFQAIDQL
ncbi:MAG: SGNH/GDSL hydrolase family protein [Cyanobacteriota bacterium]|nr:SGNH/GDSL hydrolase family protein [Cyanobacteriota bacterium]